MTCKKCRKKMELLERDVYSRGCSDYHWACDRCRVYYSQKMRYGKLQEQIWMNSKGEAI